MFSVTANATDRYCLERSLGPATLRAWGGKQKSRTIPAAWVEVGKAYVSYHLMGVYSNNALLDGMSPALRARMQGKTCFNFKSNDEQLFAELEQLTSRALTDFQQAGFISSTESAAVTTPTTNRPG